MSRAVSSGRSSWWSTSVAPAWEAERRLLRQLPDPCPEPFDLVKTVVVGRDCLVVVAGRADHNKNRSQRLASV